jgi:hypothetical protein
LRTLCELCVLSGRERVSQQKLANRVRVMQYGEETPGQAFVGLARWVVPLQIYAPLIDQPRRSDQVRCIVVGDGTM